MSYEPRIGDLVQTAAYGDAVEVVGTYAPDLWRYRRGLGFGSAHISRITPLRPDAPGQRVRHRDGEGLVYFAEERGGEAGFWIQWSAYYTWWPTNALIRIADQAPAAPVEVEAPLAPVLGLVPRQETAAEAGAAMHAALWPGRAVLDAAAAQWAAPEYAPTGPTCQHCGSGIVAGLLRDTCPRGCDLTLRAAEPEPLCVDRVEWGRASEHGGAPCPVMTRSLHEPVWMVGGHGAVASHPTREGAIAAWREAVRRG